MFGMAIRAGERTAWRLDSGSGSWLAGDSRFAPYRHELLEHGVVTDGSSTLLVVRERVTGRVPPSWIQHDGRRDRVAPDAFREAVRDARDWPLDYVSVLVEPVPWRVTVSAGRWGVAPVYLAAEDGWLHASWEMGDVTSQVSRVRLVDAAVARTLTYWRRYSAETLYAGVYRLTERARAEFDGARVAIAYPQEAEHARPRVLREGANPLPAFDALLDAAVGCRPYRAAGSAVELSGGMDSTAVALTLGERDPGQLTRAAMLIGGDAGAQQARRRAAIGRHARLSPTDHTVQGMNMVPLRPGGAVSAGREVDPDFEPFADAVDAMVSQCADAGVTTTFGGSGGDEMLALRPWERAEPLDAQHWLTPAWVTDRTIAALRDGEHRLAPASVISEMTLIGAAVHHPIQLRRGVWPVHPLADPSLIRFGEWLPETWRRGKRLFRDRMRARGMTGELVVPPLRENLAGMMGAGLRRHGLPLLRRYLAEGLVVAELGYVDPGRLREALDIAECLPEEEIDRRLYPVLSLELALRGPSTPWRPGKVESARTP